MLWQFIKNKMMQYPGSQISEENASMTYEEAVVFAESFAKRLRGPCYAILCQSELAASLAILSCLVAGVTAVPLSFRYGDRHIRNIVETVHPPFVITDAGGTLQIVDIDTGEYVQPQSQIPAVIMCTSGTTGKPKGAMLSQRNLLVNLCDIQSYFEVDAKDSILIARPLYHCAVLTGEWLLALSKGLDIRFYGESCNPMDMLSQIRAHDITVLCGTPTLLQLLARFAKRQHKPISLRHVVVSGEPLGNHGAARIREMLPDTRIYHVYGLTEASPRVAWLPPELFDTRSQWVGKILPSVQVAILDEQGRMLPANTEGELCVKGGNVMLGYYGDAALTAQVLQEGWLHTGDMAVMDEEGFLQVRGRKDHMIIRAGMNLYPQEIENALLADTRVEQVLAYGIEDEIRGQQIGLLVQGDFQSTEEISKLCGALLPPYAQPSAVQLVDKLPKNGSGKIIRGGNENERI